MFGWDTPTTHREFLTWLAWLERQWNHPSRSDYYQMQTACQVARVLSKNPSKILIEHFKLPFGEEGTKEQKAEQDRRVADQAKQSWAAYLSAKLGKVVDWVTGKVVEEKQED